jgi:hypothetical protein
MSYLFLHNINTHDQHIRNLSHEEGDHGHTDNSKPWVRPQVGTTTRTGTSRIGASQGEWFCPKVGRALHSFLSRRERRDWRDTLPVNTSKARRRRVRRHCENYCVGTEGTPKKLGVPLLRVCGNHVNSTPASMPDYEREWPRAEGTMQS